MTSENEGGERKTPLLIHPGGVPKASLVSQLFGLIEGCKHSVLF